ncbi:MFS transporter [Rhodococcus sp. IEGM 1381]|uniref:MFS transporter n=1 Tax=Rhodococcus sp. IEGM 1381 TaxID=3047085 RepID=UPI0024B83314|nr:MFS transporter [Rhodococcus sp. IEGM 1381]MDI9894482.1 MFS transporter [Rhodococcus sp. IEGM 1381]
MRDSRDYRLLWSGQWVSYLGARVSNVCYPLLALWVSGGSAGAASIVAFAVLACNMLQLPAGVLIDRIDRRVMMTVCSIGRAVALGCFAFLVGVQWSPLGVLLLALVVDSVLSILWALAERGAVHSVVPRPQLGIALAQNEMRGRVGTLVGAPVGTLLYSAAMWAPFLASAVGAAVAAVAVAAIRADCSVQRRTNSPRPQDLAHEVVDGLRFLAAERFLRIGVPLVALSSGLLQILHLALTVMIVTEQHRSPSVVGWVLAAGGAGGIVGALCATRVLCRIPLGALVVIGIAGWAVLLAGTAASESLIVTAILLAIMSLIGALFNVAASTYQLVVTPAGLQGRVAGAASWVTSGVSAVGALGGGVLLERSDSAFSISVAAIAMLVLAVLAGTSRAIRHGRIPALSELSVESSSEKES